MSCKNCKQYEETIELMFELLDKEQKRLCMNFCSMAIGKSVEAINRNLKKIVNDRHPKGE